VNHLIETYQSSESSVAVLCVYCNYNQQTTQTTHELLSSVLKQVVQHRLRPSEHIKVLRAKYKSKAAKPSLDEIIQALEEEIKGYAVVFLILDALDELTEANGNRAKLLSALESLPPQFRLLVTSRDVGGIGDSFKWDKKIVIRAATEDLKAYVESRLLTETRLIRLLKGNATLSEEIVRKVAENAEGMYAYFSRSRQSLVLTNFIGSSLLVYIWTHYQQRTTRRPLWMLFRLFRRASIPRMTMHLRGSTDRARMIKIWQIKFSCGLPMLLND
jgi:hypothetical protein